jgi:hypothetical protein
MSTASDFLTITEFEVSPFISPKEESGPRLDEEDEVEEEFVGIGRGVSKGGLEVHFNPSRKGLF